MEFDFFVFIFSYIIKQGSKRNDVMKKIFPLLIVLMFVLACSISTPSDSFDERTATKVALALTATALDQEISQQKNESSSPGSHDELSATATTEPPPPDDPKQGLGQPTWKDDLSTGQYWSLDSGEKVIDSTTTFSVGSGKLSARSDVTGKGNIYWLTHLKFQDAYLEAIFDVEDCLGDDQYGLVVRAPDYESRFGYYFHITCNGNFDLRRWSSEGSTMLLGMPSSEKIRKGPNQTNTLGMWVKGPIIRLYVNNSLLKEVNDSNLENNGYFGLFINARQTPGFTIKMDEIKYWTLK